MKQASTKPENMKFIANLLTCRHAWGEPRNVRVVDHAGKPPRDGRQLICSECGTNRIDWPDGTSTAFGSNSLSETPPNG